MEGWGRRIEKCSEKLKLIQKCTEGWEGMEMEMFEEWEEWTTVGGDRRNRKYKEG